jgi:hypothetical protein
VTQSRHARDDARYPRRSNRFRDGQSRGRTMSEMQRAACIVDFSQPPLANQSEWIYARAHARRPGVFKPGDSSKFSKRNKRLRATSRAPLLLCSQFADESRGQTRPHSTTQLSARGLWMPATAVHACALRAAKSATPASRIFEDHQRRGYAVRDMDGMLRVPTIRGQRWPGGWASVLRGAPGDSQSGGTAWGIETARSGEWQRSRPSTASAVVSRVLQHIRAWMIHSYQDKHSNHIVARCSP